MHGDSFRSVVCCLAVRPSRQRCNVEFDRLLRRLGLWIKLGRSFGSVGSGSTLENNNYFLGTGKLKITAPLTTVVIIK